MFTLRHSTLRAGHAFRPTFQARLASTGSPSPQNTLKKGLYATAVAVSTGLFAVYYLDSRSAIHRYIITPTIRNALDPETSHRLAVRAIGSGMGPRDTQVDDERLKLELWGTQISNPVGLAAGFDKNGEAVDGLLDLGFSWVEIGSITPNPQPGNPQPRVFHLPEDDALINRYGFPSDGHALVLSRLRARISPFEPNGANLPASQRPGTVLAVNLGKNKSSPADSIADFVSGVETFGPYADVLVINVSSPNTPGLRGLQTRAALANLLNGVNIARKKIASSSRISKLVVKIAPDLSEPELLDIASVIRENEVDGVIVSNTTVARPSSLINPNKGEQGGLSGKPLKPYTLAALRILRPQIPGSIPLIGCGGISTGADALEYAEAGASLVQIYTSFGYDGAGACRRIKDELNGLLAKEGTTWQGIVDSAVNELSWKPTSPPVLVKAEEPSSVRALIDEAKELGKLLDQLSEKFEDEGAIGIPTPLL